MQHDFTSPYLIDFMYTYDEYAGWQANVFYTYAKMDGLKSLEDSHKRCTSAPCKIDLRFNSYATRAEVFGFAKNTIIHSTIKIVQDTSMQTTLCDTLRDSDKPYIINQ